MSHPPVETGRRSASEQESKILITQWLQSYGVNYSIETPTTGQYQQSGQAQMSARIDVTVYGSRNAANRVMNLELKAGTASLEAFRKDFEKLLREGIPGLWFHTVASASDATWRTLSGKMEEALGRLASQADRTNHAIWFAFCVLDTPQLVEFELNFNGEWRGQVSGLVADARRRSFGASYRVSQPPRRTAEVSDSSAVGGSYGAQRKLLVYAPSINTTSFLLLSIKGASYALREFPPVGPPRRFVLDDAHTTSQLESKHAFRHSINVAREWKSLESESDYWRQKIASLNRQYRLG